MADSEHNVKININGNASGAVGAFGKVVGSLKNVRSAISNVMNAFGVFGLAINGINMLVDGFKWLHEKATATARAIAKMRWDAEMRAAANETSRLVTFHEKLAKLMKDELDTLSKQREIQDIEEQGKKDAEDGRREADRARQIYEAKTPEEEQALRDRFAAEDEQRARDEKRAERKKQIATLDGTESSYTANANSLRENNVKIEAQIKDEELNVKRATTDEDKKAAQARVDALVKQRAENEAEIKRLEKEAKFLRDKIAALESLKDYDGPTAGEWQRKTEAKKRAEEETERQQREAREKDDAANEFVKGVIEQVEKENADKANELESFADRIDAADGVSQNRLTAMGLGSGVSASGDVSKDVRKIVDLLRENLPAMRENNGAGGDGVGVWGA